MASKNTQKIIRHIAKYPDKKPKDVAKAMKVSVGNIYNIRHKFKAEIAAKRQELREDAAEQLTLDLSEYPVLEEHVPAEEIQALCDRQSVDDLVDERADKYGKFRDLSEVSQRFKESLHYSLIARDKRLAPDQQEALEVILHKFARIINGDSDYVDNWKDIAGYATLVADRLEGNPR